MSIIGITLAAVTKLSSNQRKQDVLTRYGVALARIKKSISEIERKIFHISGVLIPLWYQTMTSFFGMTTEWCIYFAASVTLFVWISEILRLHCDCIQKLFINSPFGALMREREKDQVTGTAYFTLGCTIVSGCDVTSRSGVSSVNILFFFLAFPVCESMRITSV